jgi:lysine biosynthesis protein LysW
MRELFFLYALRVTHLEYFVLPKEIIMLACPRCKQKLMLTFTMLRDAVVVCPKCGSDLRVLSRDPDKVELLPPEATLNANSKPESYA